MSHEDTLEEAYNRGLEDGLAANCPEQYGQGFEDGWRAAQALIIKQLTEAFESTGGFTDKMERKHDHMRSGFNMPNKTYYTGGE